MDSSKRFYCHYYECGPIAARLAMRAFMQEACGLNPMSTRVPDLIAQSTVDMKRPS